MDVFSELIGATQSDLTIGDESTLFDLTTVKLAINRAYNKIGGMFKWPELKDALKTSTISGQEYYDYPQKWKPDSIWKLTVDGVDYGDPLALKDYFYEQENNMPSGLVNMWASQSRRYFITPVPATNGDNNISIFGFKAVESLELDGDVTIFSYAIPECNEAIVLEATAILKTKGELQQVIRRQFISGSEMLSLEAKSIVVNSWSKISQDQARLEHTIPAWNVPNFFPERRIINGLPIGNFGNSPNGN